MANVYQRRPRPSVPGCPQPESATRFAGVVQARSNYRPWVDAPAPRVAPTCAACTFFRPGQLNPTAGVGACAAGHGHHHPMQHHWCRHFESK